VVSFVSHIKIFICVDDLSLCDFVADGNVPLKMVMDEVRKFSGE
jgi:hypothetical protein